MQSRRWKAFTLFALASLSAADLAYDPAHRVIFGKASFSTEATLYIPESKLELALDRRCIHLFLAEYERTLILRDEDGEVLRIAAAVDTGGNSRMDVYRISHSEFYLEGTLDFDRYLLDVSRPSVAREGAGKRPPNARLLGAFDRDEDGWRFIPSVKEEL